MSNIYQDQVILTAPNQRRFGADPNQININQIRAAVGTFGTASIDADLVGTTSTMSSIVLTSTASQLVIGPTATRASITFDNTALTAPRAYAVQMHDDSSTIMSYPNTTKIVSGPNTIVLAGVGSNLVPTISIGESNTGFYRPNAGQISATCAGTAIATFRSGGLTIVSAGSNAAPALSIGEASTGLYRGAAGQLDVSCGGTTSATFTSSLFAVAGRIAVIQAGSNAAPAVSVGELNTGFYRGAPSQLDVTCNGTAVATFTAAAFVVSGSIGFSSTTHRVSRTGNDVNVETPNGSVNLLTANAVNVVAQPNAACVLTTQAPTASYGAFIDIKNTADSNRLVAGVDGLNYAGGSNRVYIASWNNIPVDIGAFGSNDQTYVLRVDTDNIVKLKSGLLVNSASGSLNIGSTSYGLTKSNSDIILRAVNDVVLTSTSGNVSMNVQNNITAIPAANAVGILAVKPQTAGYGAWVDTWNTADNNRMVAGIDGINYTGTADRVYISSWNNIPVDIGVFGSNDSTYALRVATDREVHVASGLTINSNEAHIYFGSDQYGIVRGFDLSTMTVRSVSDVVLETTVRGDVLMSIASNGAGNVGLRIYKNDATPAFIANITDNGSIFMGSIGSRAWLPYDGVTNTSYPNNGLSYTPSSRMELQSTDNIVMRPVGTKQFIVSTNNFGWDAFSVYSAGANTVASNTVGYSAILQPLNGGRCVLPSGVTPPAAPVTGEIFLQDNGVGQLTMLYRDSTGWVSNAVSTPQNFKYALGATTSINMITAYLTMQLTRSLAGLDITFTKSFGIEPPLGVNLNPVEINVTTSAFLSSVVSVSADVVYTNLNTAYYCKFIQNPMTYSLVAASLRLYDSAGVQLNGSLLSTGDVLVVTITMTGY